MLLYKSNEKVTSRYFKSNDNALLLKISNK